MNSHHHYHMHPSGQCRPGQRHQGQESIVPGPGHEQEQRRRRPQWRHLTSPPPSECRSLQQPNNKPKVVQLQDADELTAVLAADGYRLGSTVGHGSYSKVRMALKSLPDDRNTMIRVACKVIDKRREAGGSYVRKFLPRELDILCVVRHPNVVRTHRIYVTPSTVHVFMDYCENGDLLSHLQHAKSIPVWQAHTFFKQICEAVDYLHRNDISHRDIKCENVLLDTMRHVKLTDFGFARTCKDERGRKLLSQTYCGSSSYAAPEVLQGIPYDPKAYDIWALGVVLYVMLTDAMPYPQTNRQQIVVNQIAKKIAKPKRSLSKEALRLVSIILEPDVTKRATINQIKNHPWVKQQNPYHYYTHPL